LVDVVSLLDDEDDTSSVRMEVLTASDLSKYVMPYVTLLMVLRKRVQTMNSGSRLPSDLRAFFDDQLVKGVEYYTFQQMAVLNEQMAAALLIEKPLSEQVFFFVWGCENNCFCYI
jgi:hypothetical protein